MSDEDRAKSELLKPPEFTEVAAGTGPEIKQIEPLQPKQSPWNPDQHAAAVQASLAFRLIWVLVGVLLGGGALFATTAWTGLAPKDVSGFFGVAFSAMVTLATAATSFWFGSQKGRQGPPSN